MAELKQKWYSTLQLASLLSWFEADRRCIESDEIFHRKQIFWLVPNGIEWTNDVLRRILKEARDYNKTGTLAKLIADMQGRC